MKTILLSLFVAAFSASIASAATITLSATVRDFKASNLPGGHPDFESSGGDDRGLVGAVLPASKDPVYLGGAGTATTHGAGPFNMWYGGPAVNGITAPQVITTSLTLNETVSGSGIYTYSSNSFFPVDGLGFGNEGNSHNYHFTLETHTQFTFQPGQVFSFTGDDDVWVYIDNKLVIDLGGVHGAESANVDLNTLGLTAGQTYDFDFYFAERHTTESNLTITTSIPLRTNDVPDGGSSLALLVMSLGGLAGVRRWMKRKA